MNILIVNNGVIPAFNYGGTQRVIWYLGKELVKMGHKVTYLVGKGSFCDFAVVKFLNDSPINNQIPDNVDIVHFNFEPEEEISKPYIITNHGNRNNFTPFNINSVFVSKNHAERYGSVAYVYNGLDWDDYGKPELSHSGNYFHFLGNAAWRVKNLQGAIDVIKATKSQHLKVLGGKRLNFSMGFRFTVNPRVSFYGMVGGEKKNSLLKNSRGLIFPVRWHEPFGLALTESLYFGAPVFGTPYGSLPEIVNSEVGFLSSKSSEIIKAVENYQQFSRQKCHQYAVDQFNSKKMAESYLEKYLQVLSGKTLNHTQPKLLKLQDEKFLEWN